MDKYWKLGIAMSLIFPGMEPLPQFHFGLQPDKIVEYKQTHGWSDTIYNVVVAHWVNSFWQGFWYQIVDMFYSGNSGPIGIHHNK